MAVDAEVFDHPGADTGERHRAVHVSVLLSYHLPNPRTRKRTYRSPSGATIITEVPREDVQKFWTVTTSLNEQALDEESGPDLIAKEVALAVRRDLRSRRWPHRDA